MTEVAMPVETGSDEDPTTTSPQVEGETQTVPPISLAEFEQLIRRIVREEVGRLLQAPKPSILDDGSKFDSKASRHCPWSAPKSLILATEGEGFEPPETCASTVFKSACYPPTG